MLFTYGFCCSEHSKIFVDSTTGCEYRTTISFTRSSNSFLSCKHLLTHLRLRIIARKKFAFITTLFSTVHEDCIANSRSFLGAGATSFLMLIGLYLLRKCRKDETLAVSCCETTFHFPRTLSLGGKVV